MSPAHNTQSKPGGRGSVWHLFSWLVAVAGAGGGPLIPAGGKSLLGCCLGSAVSLLGCYLWRAGGWCSVRTQPAPVSRWPALEGITPHITQHYTLHYTLHLPYTRSGDAEVAGDGSGGRGRRPGWPGGGPRGVQCEQVSNWRQVILVQNIFSELSVSCVHVR